MISNYYELKPQLKKYQLDETIKRYISALETTTKSYQEEVAKSSLNLKQEADKKHLHQASSPKKTEVSAQVDENRNSKELLSLIKTINSGFNSQVKNEAYLNIQKVFSHPKTGRAQEPTVAFYNHTFDLVAEALRKIMISEMTQKLKSADGNLTATKSDLKANPGKLKSLAKNKFKQLYNSQDKKHMLSQNPRTYGTFKEHFLKQVKKLVDYYILPTSRCENRTSNTNEAINIQIVKIAGKQVHEHRKNLIKIFNIDIKQNDLQKNLNQAARQTDLDLELEYLYRQFAKTYGISSIIDRQINREKAALRDNKSLSFSHDGEIYKTPLDRSSTHLDFLNSITQNPENKIKTLAHYNSNFIYKYIE
jgi:hypothetical protein